MAGSEWPEPLASRAAGLADWVEALFDDEEALVAAVEGWPEPMVREGFAAHRRTWEDIGSLVDAFCRELRAFGGIDALSGWRTLPSGRALRLRTPGETAHLWPTLPGAGMGPVMFGALLGVAQTVYPSERGSGFAEFAVERWRRVDALPPLELRSPDDDGWIDADVVVVSGTDESIRAVETELIEAKCERSTRLVGYGHRVSFGVLPRSDRIDPEEVASGFARDAVLWNQAGCFSLRGLLVEGGEDQLRRFSERVGRAIADREEDLDAVPDPDAGAEGIFERRLQRRQVAEFQNRACGSGFGWAEPRETAFDGSWVSTHTVTTHSVDGPEEIGERIDLAPHHLQGAAVPDVPERETWCRALAKAGVTRIAEPGALQAPPIDWLHDGRTNIADWLSATTRD